MELEELEMCFGTHKTAKPKPNVAEAFATLVAFYIGVMDGDDVDLGVLLPVEAMSCSCSDVLKLHSLILPVGHMFPRPLSLHD